MNQKPRAHDMTQKFVSQSLTLVGAFDEPWDIGNNKALPILVTHNSEIGHERRERIIGDLRPNRRNRCNERRLTGIGKPDKCSRGGGATTRFPARDPAQAPRAVQSGGFYV